MKEAEVVELHELHYSDLILLSSSSSSSSLEDDVMSKMGSVMEALGPMGPGLLAVTGIPKASKLRSQLLPLARKLALLDRETRKRVLKEHNLGSDVPLRNPDRTVSSFATQLKYAKAPEDSPLDVEQTTGEFHDMEFKNLGSTFEELGFFMMEIGLCLARICDKAIGGNELEQSLLESCAAKGRLIHYHSPLDGLILKEAERSKRTGKRKANNVKRGQDHFIMNVQKPLQGSSELNLVAHDANSCRIHSSLWQQWHYDYGIFTVLTAPFFISPSYSDATKTEDPFSESCYDESPSPTGHSCLQIYDPNKKRVLMVKAPPADSFIIQVGESADIISKGKLRAALHAVHRPSKFMNLSRETFVVFLQPAWTKTFSVSDYPHANLVFDGVSDKCLVASDNDKLSDEIQKIVPPLSSRLKDGMTFAEFSRETTKQYYGGSGLQSNR